MKLHYCHNALKIYTNINNYIKNYLKIHKQLKLKAVD